MLYKEFKGEKLSALGFGAMRMPTINGVYADVDQEKVDEMVAYAMEHGINYYDTAYGYHDGNSEGALGKALSRYDRDSFNVSTKFPGYDVSNFGKTEEIFEEQLARTGLDYFDFYLLHNVSETNVDYYLDPKYGTVEYLAEQKKKGRIRHLGFSAHGSYDVIKRFLDVYGDQMEFCQLQLNYLDWEFQDAKKKAELVQEYGLPVWVMEPLRGGKLVDLPEEQAARLTALRPDEPVLAWAFRFLQTVPGITMVLSGFSSLEQTAQNIDICSESKPLNEEEMATLLDVAASMVKAGTVPCTACRYCTSHCPMGLEIPKLLEMYNEHLFTGGGFIAPMFIATLPDDKKPSACIGCRSCEAVCPQQIKISEVMSKFSEML